MNAEIVDLRARANRLAEMTDQLGAGYGAGGRGGGPMPPDLEGRIRQLEQDVAVIRSNHATKADIANLRADMHDLNRQAIMWNVGTLIATAGVILAIARFVS